MDDLVWTTFSPRHVRARSQWLNQSEVLAGIPVQGVISEETTAAWCTRVLDDMSRQDFVLEDKSGSPLVMCGVTGIDETARRGELYMFGGVASQGRGFGTVALQRLCAWAFGERQLNRLFLYTLEQNAGARRFYERQGFVQEGCLRQHSAHQGRLVDRYVHGLLAADYVLRRSERHG